MEQRQSQGQGGRRRQIPAFGRWNQHSDEVPITQYFESAVQASSLLVRPAHCYHDAGAGEVLLFRSSASPPAHKPPKKVRSTMEDHGHHQQVQVEEVGSRRRQEPLPPFVAGAGSRAARPRVVRAAVDEDLYKVPSDMLRKKKGIMEFDIEKLKKAIATLTSMVEETSSKVRAICQDACSPMALTEVRDMNVALLTI